MEFCLPVSSEVKTKIRTICPCHTSDVLILFWKALCNTINTPFGGAYVLETRLLQQAWWLEACVAGYSNLGYCWMWAVKQQVSCCLKKSSGSPKVTVHYRGWILSSYVYDTQMEREWVGIWFSDFQVQLQTLDYMVCLWPYLRKWINSLAGNKPVITSFSHLISIVWTPTMGQTLG